MRAPDSTDSANAPRSALGGLRVLEIGEGKGVAYAGKLLAEYGADVVKVEGPEGDPIRAAIALADAPDADGQLHRWLNNGKRSVTVDWRRDAESLETRLAPLLDGADVVISSVAVSGRDAPATARALTPEALREGREQLIVAHVSDFGADGPLADRMGGELALYAMSGLLGASGPYDRPPVMHGAGVAWLASGTSLAVGVLTALWERGGHGHGQIVDVAALDCMIAVQAAIPFVHPFTGVVTRRVGKAPRVDLGVLACKDGYVASVVGRDGWERFVALVGEPELMHERFLDPSQRALRMTEIVEITERALQRQDKYGWFHEAQELGLPYAPLQTAEEVAECPQLSDRGFFIVVEGADGRHTRMPARPFLMGASPWRMQRPAPLLGDTPVGDVGWSARPAPESVAPKGFPLRGVRVLEWGTAWAGPCAAKMLADLGADVIKVEAHSVVDHGRVAPYADGEAGERFFDRMPMYQIANTSKAHMCLELSHPEAQEIFRRLASGADIVLENYTPHVSERFGLTYDDLRKDKPDLIMLSSSGYGRSGPWRSYNAYGWSLEPASGLSDGTGYADGAPVASAIPLPDMMSALHTVYALLLALEYRRRTGEGQWIDLAQYEVGVLAAVEPLLQFMSDGSRWGRRGNRHRDHAPHNIYPSAGDGTALGSDDQWVAVAVETDAEWGRLVAVLEDELEPRPEWSTAAGRKIDEDRIDAAIAEWTSVRTAEAAAETLQAAGVRAAAVHRYDQVMRNAQLWHRGALVRAEGPEVGPRVLPGVWQRYSRTPGRVRWAATNFGSQNEQVLRDLLGYDAAEIQSLYESGVTADAPTGLMAPPSAAVPIKQLIELGIARGYDEHYQQWNAAGPAVPLVREAALTWGPIKEKMR